MPVINNLILERENTRHAAEPSVGHRILIVDDNPDSVQVLAWHMESMGHEVKMSYKAEDALKLVETYTPDYIFLDISLPNMSGYEMCHIMKSMPGLKNAVFIAQTGWSDQDLIERSRASGFDHHLIKPIDLEQLKKILA